MKEIIKQLFELAYNNTISNDIQVKAVDLYNQANRKLDETNTNICVILSKNNTYVGVLNREEYELFRNKFNPFIKKVGHFGEVMVLKSKVYNATYLKYRIKEVLGNV